jgi:riboflavin biosynthesis pyrimidine reductase
MKRPYVVCHMGSTIDGRIIAERWGDNREKYGQLYEDCHNTFESQAWMVGRVTMEKDFTEGRKPDLQKPNEPISRKHYVGNTNATSFAIAVDPSGKLGWDSNEIDGDHVIEILTESVSDEYLHHLRDKNISYLFAGKGELDLTSALEQLHSIFKIEAVMLEGGGHINGSLLSAGLVDEVSLLVLPLVDGNTKAPTTFEINDLLTKTATSLRLMDVRKLKHDVVWLKYVVGNK